MTTPEETSRALRACRERIDKVDLKLLDLLNERASIVQEIGRIKSEGGIWRFMSRAARMKCLRM